MPKKVNLLNIKNLLEVNARLLVEEHVKEYIGLESIKPQEIVTIQRFCQYLETTPFYNQFYENYYLNYKIPQIDKEFDLLRVGIESIINIELKSELVDEEKILKQLKRNYYYLSFLEKEVHCYTFLTDCACNMLFYFDVQNDELQQIADKNHLLKNIYNLEDIENSAIDSLFTPSNYLISPFNTTDKFIEGKYFLTKHQEIIKNEIMKTVGLNNHNKIFSISGTAGTGKTLLTYDIAKELRNNGISVTIIHCAQLNNGITQLISEYQWNIRTIKNYSTAPSSDIFIIDEAQRLTKSQFEAILTIKNKIFIFSHDANQRLNRANQAKEVVALIKSNAYKVYELSHKIRHNKNLSSFVKKFYDLNKINIDELARNNYENINIYYAKNVNDAEKYVNYLVSNGWEYIYLTNSLHNRESLDILKFSSHNSAHKAIGQEYDNVVVTIDQNFFYKENGKLAYRHDCFYSPLETLFQAITRTRKKIMFVIINNEEVYRNCIKIINRK